MAPAVTRVGLTLGERRVDVAVPHAMSLAEALRSAGVALGPRLAVVDSGGHRVDVYSAAGGDLVDGAVLHVVEVPSPARGGRGPRAPRAGDDARADPLSARPPVPWALALAAVAAVVVLGVVLLDPAAGPGVRGPVGAGLLSLAVALALVPTRWGAGTWTTVAAVGCAAAGAAAAVPTHLPEAARLASSAALVCGTAAAVLRWGAARRRRDPAEDVAVVLAVVLGAVAVATVSALALRLPAVLAAAVVLGAVPLALRVLPAAGLDVPDEQLLDVSPVARTVSVVRAPRTPPLGRVNERRVRRTVHAADRRRDAGTVLLVAVAVAAAPVALLRAPVGVLEHRATAVAVALVALTLALQPRSSRSPAVRWAARTGWVVLVLLLAVVLGARVGSGGPASWSWALVPVAVGLGVAGLSLAYQRGWRSVAWSRAADGLESLATVLALPVALLGAGAVELLRRTVS